MVYDHIVMDSEQIHRCIERLAGEVSAVYRPEDRLLGLVVLEGAARFAADLLSKVNASTDVVYLRAASYHGGFASTGTVKLEGDLSNAIPGRKVLIIDDIYDTGRTLDAIVRMVTRYGPADVKTCVLLEKNRPHEAPVAVDFVGAQVEDAFLIGYGLDYEGRHRDLPFVAAMRPPTDAKSMPEF
ncbi:MAG: hypoxanthine phosphoribosyltransferase [Phycisphaerae bacterium]|nr:hypoxanthine phosphoribosyltransferase [Phycisphaerae bacterium]